MTLQFLFFSVRENHWILDRFGQKWLFSGSPHVSESKTVLDSGFLAVDSRFQVLDSRLCQRLGFRIPIFSRILQSLSCIPDSNEQHSWFHKQRFLGFQNPHSLTWGDREFKFINNCCSKSSTLLFIIAEQNWSRKPSVSLARRRMSPALKTRQ